MPVCKECHHLPSSRDVIGVGRCYCKCHDAADAMNGAERQLAEAREQLRQARGHLSEAHRSNVWSTWIIVAAAIITLANLALAVLRVFKP